jgi:hypothetical protein
MVNSSDQFSPAVSTSNVAESRADLATSRPSGGRVAAVAAAIALILVGVGVWRFFASDIGSGRHGTLSGSGAMSEAEASRHHPLWPVLQFAEQVQKNIEANVRDYTATMIKQERINGKLAPEEICFVKIRNSPLSVYMNFLAPPDQKGTEAIYVEGANDGKLVGHAGTFPKSLAGSLWLPPTGVLAMQNQHYPITEMGVANLARRLIQVGELDIHYGECYVWRNENALVGDRPCISITVLHPFKRRGFLFHVARIFVDKELMVPVHFEAYDWPEKPGDPLPLLERYTYSDIKMNPGLTDADFDPKNSEYHFGL